MVNRKDPAWKYGVEVEGGEGKGYKYLQCNFCQKVIEGGVKRMKNHLAGNHKDVAPCPSAPAEVKEEIKNYIMKGEQTKMNAQRNYDEMVDTGAYYGQHHQSIGGSSGGIVNTRGVRGPMDHYVVNVDDDKIHDPNTNHPGNPKEARNLVCLDIGRFFFENGIPFNVASSPSFVNMCRSIGNYGRGFKPPTDYELKTWILKEEENTTQKYVDELKKTWAQTGVSILSDGWKDIRGRSLINFLVNNPHGTVFLKSVDASDAIKDSDLLFNLLNEVVEEVGEEHVIQVVTDNASNYKLAGQKLMAERPHLWWTPCAAHCIDLMLEKLGNLPQHKHSLTKAKKVSNFIYNHGRVLALMRTNTKREILRPAATRFATSYLTLQSMLNVKQPLEAMFTSQEWSKGPWAKKSEGKEAKRIILNRGFWASVVYAIKTTKPLVSVLRMADSEKMPGMGFIYGAMDSAKEEISKNLDGEEGAYKEIWDIIDEKWDMQLHRHLHAAAYFLNPHYQYDGNFSDHPEVKLGLYACMDKLIREPGDRLKADLQIDTFRRREGLFGYNQARASCKIRSPVDWWIQFGDQTPELRSFAVRILGLTCSSSACERNWSTFNQVHTKKRNRLSTTKLNTLVYIMYNKKLKDRHLKKKALNDDEDSLVLDYMPSDDEWIAEEDSAGSPESGVTQVGDGLDDVVGPRTQGTQGTSRTRESVPTLERQRGKRKAPQSRARTRDKGNGLRLVDEEAEWDDLSSDDDENDDRAIRYDDDSMDDPPSDDNTGDYSFDPNFFPLDTNDSIFT